MPAGQSVLEGKRVTDKYPIEALAHFKGMGPLKNIAAGGTGWFYSFFLANITNGGTAPLIPLFLVVAFSGTLLQVGLVTAATSIASIPAFIIWGNLSDHLHRRKLFIVEGIAGLAVSMAIMWLSVDFAMFLAANFLLGLLYAASAPAGTALLIERTPKEQWSTYLGRFSKLGGAGYLLGLVAGGIWFSTLSSDATSMRLFFAFATFIAVLGSIAAVLLVKEGDGSHSQKHGMHWSSAAVIPLHISERAKYMPSRIGAVIRLAGRDRNERKEISSRLWLYYAVTMLFSTGFTAFYAVFPTFLSSYRGGHSGIGESAIFLVYIGSSLAATLTYGRVSAMARRSGEGRLQAYAASARSIMIPGFFLAGLFAATPIEAVGAMLLLNSIMGFCWAIISVTGQSMVAAMAGPHARGEAIGLYNASTGVGAIVGAIAGGYLAQTAGYLGDFLICSLSIVTGVVLLVAEGMAHGASSLDPGVDDFATNEGAHSLQE